MDNDKTMQSLREQCEIHRMPAKIPQVYLDYGLWLLYYGHNRCPANAYPKMRMRYFEYYSVSHLIEGGGKFWHPPRQESLICPGQCVIVPPGFVNRYGGDENVYHEDLLCFAGPVADMLHRSGVIRPGIYEMGSGRRLLSIMKLAAEPSVQSRINACFELQRLLFDLYNKGNLGADTKSTIIDELIETLKQQVHRWWTVEEMADFCNLSDDQFRRLFVQQTGVLPKIFFDQLKLEKAAEALSEGKLNVAEVAARFGYADQYHFSRRFKAVMGFSPSRRKSTVHPLPQPPDSNDDCPRKMRLRRENDKSHSRNLRNKSLNFYI